MVPDRTPLNAVKYATKDFQSIFDAVMRRLRDQYGDIYNDYATSAVGIMLMDLFSYATEQLQWYLDRVASDCYLATARTSDAIAMLTKQIGYKMLSAASSSVDLTVTFPNGIPFAGPLPSPFQFGGPSGLIFETAVDYSLDASVVPVTNTITVREGATKTATYTSDGTQNQKFNLSSVTTGLFAAQGSVRVWVDGQEWTEVQFLQFVRSNQFEVGYNDNPPTVLFGDGIAGNIPPAGAEVKIQFVVMSGAAGNVKSNTITTVISSLIIQGQPVTLTCTNPNGSSGGTDPEDVEHARRYAPNYFAARDAVITQRDYEALANTFVSTQYGAIAKAFANVVRSAYSDEILNADIDSVNGIVKDNAAAMASQESAISAAASALASELNEAGATQSAMATIKDSNLTPNVATVQTTAQAAKVSATTIYSDLSTASHVATAEDAQIDLISDPTVKAALQTLSSQMHALITDMQSRAGSLGPQMDTISSAAQVLDTSINGSLVYTWTYADATARVGAGGFTNSDIGKFSLQQDNDSSWMLLSITPTWMQVSNVQSIASGLDDLANELSSMTTQKDTITAAAFVISGAAAKTEAKVISGTAVIQSYISTIFDGDCRANVVQVPILARAGDGSYVAPSSGLIQAVQAFLDSRKEVTQQVQVIDGSFNLVPATIVIEVSILPPNVVTEVIAQIDSVVTGLLTARNFNAPLYLDDVYAVIRAQVAGQVSYFNAQIVGPVEYLDAYGNLAAIGSHKVIVKGSVTINEV